MFLNIPAWIAVLFVFGGGCDDVRRHQATDAVSVAPVAVPLPAEAPPAEVAKAMLEAIRDAQHARSSGLGIPENRERYDAALATIWGLADAERVYQRLIKGGPHQIPATVDQEAALTAISESWISMLAHYADGIMTEIPTSHERADGKSVLIAFQAKNPSEAERLALLEGTPEITGAKGPDGEPIAPGTKPYIELLRAKTLKEEPPFNVPIETEINIELTSLPAGWRVAAIAVDPITFRRVAPPASQAPSAQ